MPDQPANNEQLVQQIQQLQQQLEQNQAREISRVAVKPVPFLKDQPDLYFLQLEAQFRNSGIVNDQTKYDHAISQFDPKYLQMVTDLLRNPPPADKYETFKQRILKEFTDSDQRKLRRLIKEIELGDDKPSQLLKRMKDLAGASISDDALKSLWIERLPESVRAVISIVEGDSSLWAKQADKMMEVTKFATISAVNQTNASQDPLQAQIEALTKEIAELKANRRSRDNKKFNDEKATQRSRSKSKSKSPFCFYHTKFGLKARKCQEPCELGKKQGEKTQNNSEN